MNTDLRRKGAQKAQKDFLSRRSAAKTETAKNAKNGGQKTEDTRLHPQCRIRRRKEGTFNPRHFLTATQRK